MYKLLLQEIEMYLYSTFKVSSNIKELSSYMHPLYSAQYNIHLCFWESATVKCLVKYESMSTGQCLSVINLSLV